jgi:excisionase family DNA binding protein
MESMSRLPYAERMDRISVDIDKPWLTVADICEYMDVSTFVVTSVLRTGELRAVKFGREWRVARIDFEDWINAQRAADVDAAAEDQPARQ